MDEKKQKRLEAAGFAVGSADEFLGLTSEESAFVEVKLALSQGLRERRTRSGLSQAVLARRLGSSQSRVAKMEASDASVSLDLLVRALLATGADARAVAELIKETAAR
jgi:DNA-binding XRE family transcriptional regulator